MLGWIFGQVQEVQVHLREERRASGYIEFEKARVRWFLSIDENDLPNDIKTKGQRTFRSITINETEIEFSDGFTELHTESYKNILEGNGFGLSDARPSVEIAHSIRNSKIIPNSNLKHKFLS